MTFDASLQELLKLSCPNFSQFPLEPLSGDASSRRYFRIHNANESRIVMQYHVESALRSEEGASARVPLELPFVNIQRYLYQLGLPVPRIDAWDPVNGLILLSDFGDQTLEAFLEPLLNTSQQQEILDIYAQSIDLLVQFQVAGTANLSDAVWAQGEIFSAELFRWELQHYYQYGLEALHGPVAPKDADIIGKTFDMLATRLGALPRVLVHRDYHSRNVMVQDGHLGLLDFQDALMGPRHYDLASLLRDSYVTLEESLIDRLIVHYLERWDAVGGSTMPESPKQFRKYFDWISIQRNLKAAGRFVYIDRVKGNSKFLPYVSPSLARVKKNLQKYPAFHKLYETLATYVPEFRTN